MTSADQIPNILASAIEYQQHADYVQAEKLYRSILRLQPRHPDALHYLGLLAHQTGKPAQALDLLEQSLALAPSNGGFHFNYARMLSEQHRAQEAIPHFQRALELRPTYSEAWHGLAMALSALGHPEDAVACWQRGLSIAPRNPEAWAALADVQHSMGLLPEAQYGYRKAMDLSPDDHAIRIRFASLLVESGALDDAVRIFENVLQEHPDSPEAHYQYGVLLTNLGKFSEARNQFEAALKLSPDFYQAAVHLVAIHKISLGDQFTQRLQAADQHQVWREPGQGINVHFTLAKIYQDNGDFVRAFEHYQEGNRLRRETLDYSSEAQERLFDSIKRAFGPGFIARKGAIGVPSESPVFIVGMPRSGTSLVEQILANHKQVHGGGELTYLHSALRRRLGASFRLDFAASVAGLNDSDLHELAKQCLADLHALAPHALRITDKMPSNFMILGLVHSLYPRARIIYCRRDPLDTCVSCFTTLFRSGHEFTSDLEELGRYYRLHEDLMRYWNESLPEAAVFEIQYERLIADPEGESRRLIAYCGLKWDPACLEFNTAKRTVSTASVFQVRQPIYHSAIGRWRHYATQLVPLKEALERNAPLPAVTND